MASTGTLVILLHKFANYFTSPLFEESLTEQRQVELEAADNQTNAGKNMEHPPRSLVNQAFAVAIQKVLEGYLCALDTLNASAHVRRSFDSANLQSNSSRWQGSLTSVSHSEITLLEVYLHTKELRMQIEALGNLCHLHDAAFCFSQISFEELLTNEAMEFCNFPRGANLLTYLYEQLRVSMDILIGFLIVNLRRFLRLAMDENLECDVQNHGPLVVQTRAKVFCHLILYLF